MDKLLREAINIIEELNYEYKGGCCPATFDSGFARNCQFDISNCPFESGDCWRDYLARRVQDA